LRTKNQASKSELIKARVSAAMKEKMARLAAARGESEAVMIREAIAFYLRKTDSRRRAR
jgi:predicted DNA-binding protein